MKQKKGREGMRQFGYELDREGERGKGRDIVKGRGRERYKKMKEITIAEIDDIYYLLATNPTIYFFMNFRDILSKENLFLHLFSSYISVWVAKEIFYS